MPVAWMISSNGREETICFFLKTIRTWNPHTAPWYFMSDMSTEQLKAIVQVYPETQLLFCWWHVLNAWQKHLVIESHPELWELLKNWIRITDQEEFNKCWQKIQILALPSMWEYLQTYYLGGNGLWTSDPKFWSAVYWVGHQIMTPICF